ncbi:MAG: hypothetical protein IT258_02105 [Saprospiraceae bacterium]|nr:hypothetical protein [Saprospiraceae bacterium]
MNNFVTIRLFKHFEKVNFYAFQIEGEEDTEPDKFFNRFENELEVAEDLNNLIAWIEEIGDKRGAKEYLFRFEESAQALPPSAKFLVELPVRDLRLYCVRLSDEIVILANGGLKTSQKVAESPDLMAKFRFANRVSKCISEMIKSGGFQFAGKEILNLDELEIEI